jgi:hypothetical protein
MQIIGNQIHGILRISGGHLCIAGGSAAGPQRHPFRGRDPGGACREPVLSVWNAPSGRPNCWRSLTWAMTPSF